MEWVWAQDPLYTSNESPQMLFHRKDRFVPLKWKTSIAAIAVLVLGMVTACGVAYVAVGQALEKSMAARVAGAAKHGMTALDDVRRRVDAYARLFAARPDLAEMLEANDVERLERTAVVDFNDLCAIDALFGTLEFTDARGVVVMRGHSPGKKGDDKSKTPQVSSALRGENANGLTVSKTSGEAAQDAVYPVRKGGRIVGTVKVGAYFRADAAREIKQLTGLEIIFALDGVANAVTLGDGVAVTLSKDQVAGNRPIETVTFGERSFLAQFAHRASDVGAGVTIGFLADRAEITQARAMFTQTLAFVGAAVIVLLCPLLIWFTTRFTQRLLSVATSIRRVSEGHLADVIPHASDVDEIGQIATAVSHLRDAAIEKKRLEETAAATERQAIAARIQAEEEAVSRERSIVASSIGAGMARLAKKDLTVRLQGLPAAYRQLESDFNRSMQELEAAIHEVQRTTEVVQVSTQDIGRAASDVAQRTEQQASRLEQTAAAVGQITATGRKAAEGAQQARDAVTSAKIEAEGAGAVVGQAVDAMHTIEKSSGQIENIIGVINEIAFQTNLLALNAGVEAARAGEAGRGFAVVASEVRGLAQRSAEAAKEIKALISASSVHVREGARLVSQTGETLERIARQVVEINAVVSRIAAGAAEQAASLQEVNEAVSQMDRDTQKNAAMVEETTHTSRSLAQAGRELKHLIAQFHLSTDDQRAAA